MTKEETYVILNKNNLALEILLNDGYFTDQIPPCFTTKSLAKANSLDILEKVNSVSEKNDLDKKCFPIEITVYKDDILRRTLHFPNIVKYLKLLKKMSTRFDVYDSLLDSKHSESNAKILKKFDYPSNYQKSIIKRNSEFAGYKYKLKIDISHCYESIYSHSITWALVGKTIAKQMYLGQIKKSTLYNTGNDFDKFCSALKGNETNGIVVGPYSSRIISEIVLCGLDKELEEEKFKFTRYVDDYNFYFTSKFDCEKNIPIIARILNGYNFKVNSSKIQILKYPFDVLEDFSSLFEQSKNKKFEVYDILHKAQKLDIEGKKGSYKYALKYILENEAIDLKKLSIEESMLVFNVLLSMLINKPFVSRYVVHAISQLSVVFSDKEPMEILNTLLKAEINSAHDQEVLWLLYIIFRYNSQITQENVISVLEKGSDLSKIMILDLITNHKNVIVNYNRKFANQCKNKLLTISKDIELESFFTKRWLLKYQILKSKFTPYKSFNLILNFENDKIYKIFKDKDITFYTSPFND